MTTARRTTSLIIFLAFASCAPQAELVKTRSDLNEVRSEIKTVRSDLKDVQGIKTRLDQLDASVKEMSDLQKATADQGVRSDQIVTDLQILQGKIEENNYRLTELAQKLDDKTFRINELSAKVDELEQKVKALSSGAPAAPAGDEKKPEAKPAAGQTLGPTEAYRQAKSDYDKGNYDLAIAGFQNYQKQFPDASQGDAAQYWIGECYYSKKEYTKAIDEFTKVLKNFPKSDKAAGARLKIGYSYLNEKNVPKAKEQLNLVLKEYPHTREADLAQEKLEKIGK